MSALNANAQQPGFIGHLLKNVQQHRAVFPVLLIDDDSVYRELISVYLQDSGFVVQQAQSVAQALQILQDKDYRLIVCDYLMPEQNGIEFCRQLRSREHSYHYLLLLTARIDPEDIVAGLQNGADDYVSKSFNKTELVARVDCGVRVLYAHQLLELQQQKLLYQVQHDVLTGLYNRSYLSEITPKVMAMTNRYQQPVAVLLADLDHFKQVNDQFGHQQGDAVLKTAAQLIRQSLRETDIAIRLGGEEFLMLLPHITLVQAWHVAEKIRMQLQHQMALQHPACKVTISVGVTLYRAGEQLEHSIKRADDLMYQSKTGGRNRCTQGA